VLSYPVTLDVPFQRVGKKTSKKGKETGTWYSGKAHAPAGNVQALAAPGGVPLWSATCCRAAPMT
jgi:hypothetical protein